MTVVAATEAMHGRPCYEVEFSDGEVIVADAQHQWLTWTRRARRYDAQARGHSREFANPVPPDVVTTEQIARTLRCPTLDHRPNHAVSVSQPLALPEADLPIPPFALGVWLGDGSAASARFTTFDPEIVVSMEASGLAAVPQQGRHIYRMAFPGEDAPVADRVCVVCGSTFRPKNQQVRTCGRVCGGKARFCSPPAPAVHCARCGGPAVGQLPSTGYCMACWKSYGTVQAVLRTLGVLGNKHIPLSYLRGSEAQRRALLAGILDTDGTVTSAGSIQLAVTNRELAEGVRELVASLGYRCSMSTKRVKGRSEASSTCYMVNFTTPDRVFWLDRKHLLHKERLHHRPQRTRWRYIVDVRQVPSRPVRCVQVDSADRLYLAGRSMIPTHNSTLALDLARAASLKHGLTTVMFSLEMSRNEITMRLLSAESRVPLHAMRTGQMGEEDWTRLARRMSEVVDAPLFIDDSPNMSLMEIRAKCRRLKQRHNLRLVIIDYLQLMSSPRRVENRQQEVSDMSRSLKLLAKELDVPVVAISQLNRGPEQRNDKRPLLSDLRESGCLTAETRLLRADTGTQVTLGSLLASPERDVPVWALDERLRLVARPMTHVFPTGIKEVFRVRLASGRQVEATGNHPFLTYDGWRPLSEIPAGSRVAVPRHVPAPIELRDMPEAEIITLARRTGHEGYVPDPVFALPKRQLALFLRHLWATDGCVWWDEKVRQARIYYASTSRRLVDDVAQLLMRFNVMTRIKEIKKDGYRSCYHLLICGAENQLRFLDDIGVHGARSVIAQRARANLVAIKGNTNLDTIPHEVWNRVRGVLVERQMTHREFAAATGTQFGGSMLRNHAPSRERLARIASVLDDADLEMIATNDVFWDEVASVESLGMKPVYDATVAGAHNFVANGINVHNSIEQDSDVVILLHREDAYEPESPRAGEADLIVAKHRNGPTAVVTVAFQGHYSRFVDMAPG